MPWEVPRARSMLGMSLCGKLCCGLQDLIECGTIEFLTRHKNFRNLRSVTNILQRIGVQQHQICHLAGCYRAVTITRVHEQRRILSRRLQSTKRTHTSFNQQRELVVEADPWKAERIS